jgi:hypothetical protein
MLGYATSDRARAALFVYQLQAADNRPVKLRGLDPQRR